MSLPVVEKVSVSPRENEMISCAMSVGSQHSDEVNVGMPLCTELSQNCHFLAESLIIS